MRKRSGSVRKLRFSVFERDGFRCTYCGTTARGGAELEIDHVVPIASGGGSNDISNLATACVDCNVGKGSRDLLSQPPQVEVSEVFQNETTVMVASQPASVTPTGWSYGPDAKS